MSVAFIHSNFICKVAAAVCLTAFCVSAQQGNTALLLQSAPASHAGTSTTKSSAAPGQGMATAPEPKNLPKPFGIDYSQPAPLLPNPFARYIPRDVPPPAFTNAPRIEQLIQNGKLMLSINDAIAIALTDNLDIAVARYNLPIADTDILLTKSGGSPRGVNAEWFRIRPAAGLAALVRVSPEPERAVLLPEQVARAQEPAES